MLIEIPTQMEETIISQAQSKGMTAQHYIIDQLKKLPYTIAIC